MRLSLFCVAIATCVVAVVRIDGIKVPEARGFYGYKAPHKKGKKCYQCAWSPPKLAYATVKKIHYNNQMSAYGQRSLTGLYHVTKKIPVRVQGGWDKCFDRFSRKQAEMFGIDQWECEHNCYTRTDKNGNLYRGCYKGEFNVDPNKLGCHMQAGSRYCFCEGELCNYEQGQGFDGSSRILPRKGKALRNVIKVIPVKRKSVIYGKPNGYKPTYYRKYHKKGGHVMTKHGKPYLHNVHDRADRYGYMYERYADSYEKGERKTDKDYGYHTNRRPGYGNRYNQDAKRYRYDDSIHAKIHGYVKHGRYRHDKPIVYPHKALDTYKHRKHETLRQGYDEYDYGKLGYVIRDKPVYLYQEPASREQGYSTNKPGKRNKYERNIPVHHHIYKHDPQSSGKHGHWKDYNGRQYVLKSHQRSFELNPKKITQLIRVPVHELKPHRPVYDPHPPKYVQNTNSPKYSQPSQNPGQRPAVYTAVYENDALKSSYETHKPPFDYDTQKPTFDYDIDRPPFAYDAIFGLDGRKPVHGYNTPQQIYPLQDSNKPVYGQSYYAPDGKSAKIYTLDSNASYDTEPLNDVPLGLGKHTVHVNTKRTHNAVGLYGQAKNKSKDKSKSYHKRSVIKAQA